MSTLVCVLLAILKLLYYLNLYHEWQGMSVRVLWWEHGFGLVDKMNLFEGWPHNCSGSQRIKNRTWLWMDEDWPESSKHSHSCLMSMLGWLPLAMPLVDTKVTVLLSLPDDSARGTQGCCHWPHSWTPDAVASAVCSFSATCIIWNSGWKYPTGQAWILSRYPDYQEGRKRASPAPFNSRVGSHTSAMRICL